MPTATFRFLITPVILLLLHAGAGSIAVKLRVNVITY